MTIKLMSRELLDIENPIGIKRLSNTDALLGPTIAPLDRLKIIDEDSYEDLVAEWAIGYLKNNYHTVKQFGGSGDKGRDICAFTDNSPLMFDMFQCKHYDHKIAVSDILVDFGKLIHYTFIKDYSIPQNYFIVSPLGISTDLWDLISKPDDLKKKILKDWNSKISKKITKKQEIILTDEYKAYIETFDFSIIKSLEPLTFIEQFKTTSYYVCRFGGGLRKQRSNTECPEYTNEESQITYIRQLFEAYEDHIKKPVRSLGDISNHQAIQDHFAQSRYCFYTAEALHQFSRDNVPAEYDDPFEELKEEVYEQVIDVCNSQHSSGFARIKETTRIAKSGVYCQNNVLTPELKSQDKSGICHHLANEERLIWVQDGE